MPNNEHSSITDCDIVCLKDGFLIITEVKYDWNWFKRDDFTDLKIVAEKVKPDKLIFAAYGKPSKATKANLEKWVNEIRWDLEKYWTNVSCQPIESFYMH